MAVTAAQVADLRASLGLPQDPASDAIWASRGWATLGDVRGPLTQKAADLGINSQVSTTTTNTSTGGINIGGVYTRPDGGVPTAPSGDYTTGQPSGGANYGGVNVQMPSGSGDPRALRLDRAEQTSYMRTVAAQLGIPQELIDLWVQAWVDTGDQNVATAKVRENPVYDTYFPGNRRDNGTFRYTEAQYNALTENYAESLSSQGVNPDLFESKFKDLIEGNVSANEFRSRVNAISDRILNASPEALEAFGQRFGTNSASAALGVALNPQIGDAVLNRELTIAEVTGQSTRYGFNRGRSRVEALTNEGVGLEQARSFYSAAAESLPTLGGAGMRANEGGVGIGELEDVAFFGGSSKRLERIQQRERSLFSRSATTANSDGALSGLRQR